MAICDQCDLGDLSDLSDRETIRSCRCPSGPFGVVGLPGQLQRAVAGPIATACCSRQLSGLSQRPVAAGKTRPTHNPADDAPPTLSENHKGRLALLWLSQQMNFKSSFPES